MLELIVIFNQSTNLSFAGKSQDAYYKIFIVLLSLNENLEIFSKIKIKDFTQQKKLISFLV